jgi:regulator of chromosome condensation
MPAVTKPIAKRQKVSNETARKFVEGLNPLKLRNSKVGKLFICGNGDCGQLGLGDDVFERLRPAPIPKLEELEIVDAAAGGLHNIILTKDNKLYSWGCNDQGALGRTGEEFEPEQIPGLEGIEIVKLACGDSISAALTDKGQLYSWGTFRNAEGILGFSKTVTVQNTPVLVEDIPSKAWIVDVVAGADHLLALTSDGRVYGWGNGQQSQIGRKVSPRRQKDGLKPERLGIKNIVSIAAGAYHSFAIDSKGAVYSWGLNNFSQCGFFTPDGMVSIPTKVQLPFEDAKVTRIVAGEHHSLFLDDKGRVYGCGRSDSYQLGLPESANSSNDTTKRMVNHITHNEKLQNVRYIDTGSNHSVVINNENQAYSWGYGDSGALANIKNDDIQFPTLITSFKGYTPENPAKLIQANLGGQHSVFLLEKN